MNLPRGSLKYMKMDCCGEKNKSKGFLSGLVYGLAPHIGCIAFIVFAILGVTAMTALFKPLLLNPYFFYILIALSLASATISAFFYFKKLGLCYCEKTNGGIESSFASGGIKRKWKYLAMLYGTTIAVNLILFMLIFPVLTTLDAEEGLSFAVIRGVFGGRENSIESPFPFITLEVAIPCPGHAPLITGELETIQGTEKIRYRFPNKFTVNYNPEKISKEEILALDVFRTYKAMVINE